MIKIRNKNDTIYSYKLQNIQLYQKMRFKYIQI